MSNLPQERKLIVNYEHFCREPELFLHKLTNLTVTDLQANQVRNESFVEARAGYKNPIIENAIKSFEEKYG